MILHSRKYNGSLHYRYPVQIIQQTPARLVTYAEPGIPIESYRGSWSGKRHILGFFWPNHPYVLHVVWESAWRPKSLYTDIAMGTKWNDQLVEYIDLDLDVVLPHESSDVLIDDEDEFEEHRMRWSYPDDLVRECYAAVEEVRGLITARQPPFTPELFDWRPEIALEF